MRTQNGDSGRPDLFATTGDYLRIWKNSDDGNATTLECLLNNVRGDPKGAICPFFSSFAFGTTEQVVRVLRAADVV